MKVGSKSTRAVEEDQAVVRDGKAAAHRDTVNLPTETELVRTAGPAHRVEPGVVIRERRLQLGGIRPKGPSAELKPVHVGIAVGGRQVDANVRPGDGRLVIQLVADDVDAKAEFIDQNIAEQVSFGNAAETAVQRNIQGKIQIVGAGLATGLDPVGIRTERLEGIGIGPEEALGQTVFATVEFAIPRFCELVVRELAGTAQHQRASVDLTIGKAGRAGNAGK